MSKETVINVIGLGYIGLPTALSFASNGMKVIGTDINETIIQKLNNGKTTFKEEGLDELYLQAVGNGIRFTTKYEKTNAYIITVPTPYIKENKKLDCKYIIEAIDGVLDVCEQGTILVIESTISPGTIDKKIRPILEHRGLEIGKDIHLVHAPERIMPGKMIYELRFNARTIGADSEIIGNTVKQWYQSFCESDIVVTNIKTAELSKVIENTYRDINIAFANELLRICRRENIDVYELINIANKHPRVNILAPGPGVGGHCISVDPWFLVGDYPDLVNIILAARSVNDSQPDFVIHRMTEIMREHKIKDLTRVGIYGLTYKEDVDDTRESPTLQMLQKLEMYFAKGLKLYDPWIEEKILDEQYVDFDDFINDVDMIVIMVNHTHINDKLNKLEGKIILDTKNIRNIRKVSCTSVYNI